MVLKIYGHTMSTYTRLVVLICKEKEIPYEFMPVDLVKGEHKFPDFIKNQPFGQVPYIDDDGFILYESRAIARYLIKKYPNRGTPGLVPTGLKEEALFEQAASVEVSNYGPHIALVSFEKVVKPILGLPTDESRADESLKKLEATLDVYDVLLGKQRYLAGDNVTLADLQHLGHGSMLFAANLGGVFTKRTHIARWWNDISNRPAWLAIVKDGV